MKQTETLFSNSTVNIFPDKLISNDSKMNDLKKRITFYDLNIEKTEENNSKSSKTEFNLNFGKVLKNIDEGNRPLNSENYNDANSSSKSENDDDDTIRIEEMSHDDKEFKMLIESSQKDEKSVLKSSSKPTLDSNLKINTNLDNNVNQLNIAQNNESNYNLFGKDSIYKSKIGDQLENENIEIVLKNNKFGSSSSRIKNVNNENLNNNKDFILDFKHINISSNVEKNK